MALLSTDWIYVFGFLALLIIGGTAIILAGRFYRARHAAVLPTKRAWPPWSPAPPPPPKVPKFPPLHLPGPAGPSSALQPARVPELPSLAWHVPNLAYPGAPPLLYCAHVYDDREQSSEPVSNHFLRHMQTAFLPAFQSALHSATVPYSMDCILQGWIQPSPDPWLVPNPSTQSTQPPWQPWQVPPMSEAVQSSPSAPILVHAALPAMESALAMELPAVHRKTLRETAAAPVLQTPSTATLRPPLLQDGIDQLLDCKVQEAPRNKRAASNPQLVHLPRLVFKIMQEERRCRQTPGPAATFNPDAPRIGRMDIRPNAPDFFTEWQRQLSTYPPARRQPGEIIPLPVLLQPPSSSITPPMTIPRSLPNDPIPHSLINHPNKSCPSSLDRSLPMLLEHPDRGLASLRLWTVAAEPRPPKPWTIQPASTRPLVPLTMPMMDQLFHQGCVRKTATAQLPAETEEAPKLPEPQTNPAIGTIYPILHGCVPGCREHGSFSGSVSCARCPIHGHGAIPGRAEECKCEMQHDIFQDVLIHSAPADVSTPCRMPKTRISLSGNARTIFGHM